MSKRSSSSVEKLICLLSIVSFILCCQFGCSMADYDDYFVPVKPPNKPSDREDCVALTQGLLPCEEAKALQDVVSQFGKLTVNRSFCLLIDDYKNDNSRFSCSNDSAGNPHVTEINIYNLNSSGFLNPNISKLPFLENMGLHGNQLTGPIPKTLGSLKSLERLDLSGNQLTGPIPRILGSLKSLVYLDLSKNKLNGSIPDSFGNLTMLFYLDLSINQLTKSIPHEFSNLQNLTHLYLNENFLIGNTSILGELASLELIYLSFNKFKGRIPATLGKLTSLEELHLDENLFSDEIPGELGQLSNLQYLEVAGNSLNGTIPKYNWPDLRVLNLLGNDFTGPLPHEILRMPYLTKLWVSDLKNNGSSFPEQPCLKSVESLILRNCLIEGSIPSYVANWTSISYLDLSFNKLEGEIPNSLHKSSLEQLYLAENMLSGTIPEWINELSDKDLSYNNFAENAVYPPSDHEDPNYQHEQMAFKPTINFTDEPNQIINKKTIMNWTEEFCQKRPKNIKLAINSGGERVLNDGGFPTSNYNSSIYIRNLTCGATIVPNEPLHKRARLCPVNLTYYGYCLKKGSYKVKLYFAEIVYNDDSDYSSSGKRIFDVYVQDAIYEDLNIKKMANGLNTEYVYTIPKVHVKDDHLLKISLFWAGKGTIYSPSLNGYYNPLSKNGPLISAIQVTPNFKVGLSKTHTAAVSVASVVGLLFVLALLWRLDLIGDRKLRGKKFKLDDGTYSLKEIIAATGKFNDKNKIGTGHFGTLYKAKLGDGKIYAVRKLDKKIMQHQGDRIIKEFYTLNHLKHENLVCMLRGYSNANLHLLIYEYVGDQSLETILFGESVIEFNWKARVNVCKDIATGLTHLHEKSGFQIVHGDLKATNVLLYKIDQSPTWKAKISDYGLTKFNEERNPFSSTKDPRNL
ncbi:hypothetical protein ACFE04_031177 [Oxalis oulophora]